MVDTMLVQNAILMVFVHVTGKSLQWRRELRFVVVDMHGIFANTGICDLGSVPSPVIMVPCKPSSVPVHPITWACFLLIDINAKGCEWMLSAAAAAAAVK